ncbi:DODA-type extradiol aromatic ring-opening family dioxygenase [Leptolyngbya sp. AN02str]|uniref:DODA-type extradiol aromatic ring-opening family dioxygenase n=1 Tax=Leptolyngbya sp. AN02str TaxID=3423363 RepID=UPI003D313659
MNPYPAVFISHGSPDMVMQSAPAADFFRQFHAQFQPPSAILVISAHWATQQPTVSAAAHPRTIHDFYGFAEPLYQLQYRAPGAPHIAKQVQQLLGNANIPVHLASDRGLDHGAWEPLMMMYPAANIPVTQLSIQPQQSPRHHWAVGQAIAPLRHEGVLVLASGSATHNLQMLGPNDGTQTPPTWVTEFDQWLAEHVLRNDVDALLNYRQLAPYAVRNHPTDEHLLPLFVALGAAAESPLISQLHASYSHTVLSMAAYAFA